METHRATPVTAERYHHAEGPAWDARTGRLLWVGHFHVGGWDAATGRLVVEQSFDLDSPIGAVVPERDDDGWVAAAALGFVRVQADGRVSELSRCADGSMTPMRMNDGGCDPVGRFWAGSMAIDKTPEAGTLYRLETDLAVTIVLERVTISNGLAWVDGGSTMYYIDTPTRRVDRFRVDAAGRLADRTPVVHVEGGFPDGMTVDDEGCLWVALWAGGAVHRYSPAGELLAVVEVDAPQVSSCCFGGPRGATLFVTTSKEDYDERESSAHPNAGRLFAVDLDVTGPPAAPFGAVTDAPA